MRHPFTFTKNLLAGIALAIAAAGCSEKLTRQDPVHDEITKQLDQAADQRAKARTPKAVEQALLPPLIVQMPRPEGAPVAQRFDLSVNNAPANQIFMAIVSGTRYSMIVHPDVKSAISVNLKDVTVLEALDTLRELYGYEYKIQGNRIMVQPATLQSRVFQVNYLNADRKGRSDLRVASGSITDSPTTAGGGTTSRPTESSRVVTSTETNFWSDITKSLDAIVGKGGGRGVIVNPQSGVIVVHALPSELRAVESFLKAMQLIVERQVVLEAKIIEVTLTDGAQAGVNWAAFRDGSTRFGAGVVNPGTTLSRSDSISMPTDRAPDGAVKSGSALTGSFAGTVASALSLGEDGAGGVFGLALQTANFAALLHFLESQGSVNVLSSPRVATINNQKAVLKVGTDDFFVTNISTTSTTSGTSTSIAPTITVQPFFSGIALDVTPQIDAHNSIILHIHPQVSNVIEKRKVVDLGALGTFTLPLASSSVNETDTIVRVVDGNIVAIGGLMRQESDNRHSQVPGIGDAPGLGELFRQRATTSLKSELVILLKATIVRSDRAWQNDLNETRRRIRALDRPPPPQ